ncbi:hypothetical protein A0H81_05233 [Grifola frondosa]|uniref:Uncharacterized protein n=1 Tax=Grifola frondosa TaxID=5627 RepID=A0A1C7MBK4_GRIFR|nr:hypothetical protein A0H81_05233 [Grifola frondosa]
MSSTVSVPPHQRQTLTICVLISPFSHARLTFDSHNPKSTFSQDILARIEDVRKRSLPRPGIDAKLRRHLDPSRTTIPPPEFGLQVFARLPTERELDDIFLMSNSSNVTDFLTPARTHLVSAIPQTCATCISWSPSIRICFTGRSRSIGRRPSSYTEAYLAQERSQSQKQQFQSQERPQSQE